MERKALLYKDYRKLEEPVTVTVLHIGTVADRDDSYIAASVEKEDGEVIEVSHDRLKFISIRDKCEFYPKPDDGCVCYAGSDISGKFICTKEFSKTCIYANEQRKLWKGGE